MSTETQQPHELDKFQVWWNYHGQYCRAGGGEYEESFAWAAWQSAQASQAVELAALKAENEALRVKLLEVERENEILIGVNSDLGDALAAMQTKEAS